jgi:hypothetical protein
MDHNRSQQPGNNAGNQPGTTGWSPTSQPGPASGSGSISTGSSSSAAGTAIKSDRKLGGLGEDLREGTHQLREKAMERGGEVLEQVQSRVNSAVDQGKGRLADQLESVCDAVEEVADKSDNQNVSRYAHMASDQIHNVAAYLRNSDPAEMARGAQRLARRHPDIFLGGALVAGLLIGRFLRSHEPRQDYGRNLDRDFDRGYGSGDLGRSDFDRAGAGAAGIGANIGSSGPRLGSAMKMGTDMGTGASGFGSGGTGDAPRVGGAGPGIGAASTGIGSAGQKGFANPQSSGPGSLSNASDTGLNKPGQSNPGRQNKRDQNPPSQPRF